MRSINEEYPDFTSELEAIRENGITLDILYRILRKHTGNSAYNKNLYSRYKTSSDSVPIYSRKPKFNGEDGEESTEPNNKINNDFFGEIVDFKTGYFAGNPISYGYSKTEEAEEVTGGEEAIDIATKTITDFTTRNNMFGVDMEITKFASICGYAGRLFYIDPDGNTRVMPLKAYETIILSSTNISEPEYAIRYYPSTDINDKLVWTVEFYDKTNITTYKGDLSNLTFKEQRLHCFDRCPLQAVANNEELLGDAEKVLNLIDDYDKTISDNSNEIESFVHAYMVFKNVYIDDDNIKKAHKTGAIVIPPKGTSNDGEVGFITKNINDNFTEHHLERVEKNIYRFSKTPNLSDQTFGTASGISLRFKLHGLETKCGMFQAKMTDAAHYMWLLLSELWAKKDVVVDPLQVTMEFSRNFPLDLLSEAQAAQALLGAGLPKELVYGQMSFIDDPAYCIELKMKEDGYTPHTDFDDDDEEKNGEDNKLKKDLTSAEETEEDDENNDNKE